MSGRRLILVKHAAPRIAPDAPAAQWQLSDAGRMAARSLADRLAACTPAAIVTSEEPKASETGRIVAERLGLPVATAPNLHEHDRTGVPFLGPDEWHEQVRRFFVEPDVLVLGRETAIAAGERFARAVAAALYRQPTGNLAVVAHGTVISLFVARHNPIEVYALWERLGMPSFVVLGLPRFELTETVAEIAGHPPIAS